MNKNTNKCELNSNPEVRRNKKYINNKFAVERSYAEFPSESVLLMVDPIVLLGKL